MHDLPQDIVQEIFSYLPTKSVGKCRCLSKTWNTNLSTSQFIKLHQIRKPRQEHIILVTLSGSLAINEHVGFGFSRQINPHGTWARLLGSCNGLLLLFQHKTHNMFVVNPITRKQIQIPFHLLESHVVIPYGFGYDPVSDDYKVVTFYGQQNDNGSYTTNVEVYCIKTRVWKTLDYPYGFCLCSNAVMSFINGALHWFATTEMFSYRVDRICAFDLTTESFHEVRLPKGFIPSFGFDELVVVRGCLAYINISPSRSSCIYGVRDSWVKFHIMRNDIPSGPVTPVCFVGDGKMLCVTAAQCWAVYDS